VLFVSVLIGVVACVLTAIGSVVAVRGTQWWHWLGPILPLGCLATVYLLGHRGSLSQGTVSAVVIAMTVVAVSLNLFLPRPPRERSR
jgi:hypothetical protein